jgi:hypothetical protein
MQVFQRHRRALGVPGALVDVSAIAATSAARGKEKEKDD